MRKRRGSRGPADHVAAQREHDLVAQVVVRLREAAAEAQGLADATGDALNPDP